MLLFYAPLASTTAVLAVLFLNVLPSPLSPQEQMFKMFRAADHNRDGCIEPDEIMGLVKAVNPEIKRNEVQQCIAVIQASLCRFPISADR